MSKFRTSDGFSNVYKSLGQKKDVNSNTFYSRNTYITQNYMMMNALYSNPFGGKAVDIPVEDAFRGGRTFNAENQDKLHEYEEHLIKVNLDEKIEKAMKWAKIFGSAVIIIVSNDDEMSEPLVLDNLKQGDIQDLIVLDRWQLYSMDINRNPMNSNFLDPEYYYVTRTSTAIHHSRVIKIDGLTTTLYDKEVLNGWGLSVYERFYRSMQNAQMSPDLLINLLVQSNLDVYHIEGLNDALVNGNDDLAIKRIEVAQQGKSILNGVALDSKDQYSNISKSFSGLDSVHDKFIELLCGSVEIPKTRFMGEQNAGLANDGGGDLKVYYDRIEAKERNQLAKVYDKLDALLSKSLFGEVLEMDWEFVSLFQMTPEQKSIIRNRDAQTNQIYLNTGVLNELEVKQALTQDDYYVSVTTESVEEESRLWEEMENENETEIDNDGNEL